MGHSLQIDSGTAGQCAGNGAGRQAGLRRKAEPSEVVENVAAKVPTLISPED
jgi:hypothetical protein